MLSLLATSTPIATISFLNFLSISYLFSFSFSSNFSVVLPLLTPLLYFLPLLLLHLVHIFIRLSILIIIPLHNNIPHLLLMNQLHYFHF